MEASTEWPPLWIANAKRPWKRVYDTPTCLKFSSCSPFVPLQVSHCPFACSLSVPASDLSFEPLLVLFFYTSSFERFCTEFFTFSFPVVLSPPYCTCCLPIIPFPLVSFSFPPNRTFSSLSYFFPSQSYFFPLCFSRFPIKSTKSKNIKINYS